MTRELWTDPETGTVLATLEELEQLDGRSAITELPEPSRTVAHAIRRAFAELELEVVERASGETAGARSLRIWVAPAVSVVAEPTDDPQKRHRVRAFHPSHLMAELADVLDLRPRPRPSVREPAIFDGQQVEALRTGALPALDEDSGDRRAAMEELHAGWQRSWRAVVTWRTRKGAEGRREVLVIDSDAGYWTAVPLEGDLFEMAPSDATSVFRVLRALLPGEADLAG